MYAMDMRQYDPTIARWVVQDPITHHSQSPYCAFDNNPVYWKDPSGADGELPDFIQTLWDATPDDGNAYTYTFTNQTNTEDKEEENNETTATLTNVLPANEFHQDPKKPGNMDLLSEKSFRFKGITKTFRAARITNLYFSIYDAATKTTYESSFSLEIGTPITNKHGKAYGLQNTVDKCTMVLNATATQYMMIEEVLSNPLLHKLTVNDATLPYIFATLAQAKLNKYIPGSTITANTYQYKTVNEKSAVWVNWFKKLFTE